MRERGHAAVEFAMAVAVLLLPVALVVVSFGPWSERRVFAEAAAAEVSRAAVLSLDELAAAGLLESLADEHGLNAGEVRLGWCGVTPDAPASAEPGCPLNRGSVVTANIEVWVPLVSTPWGEIGGLWVEAAHSEPVDLYRSLP